MVISILKFIAVVIAGWLSGIWVNYCADVLPEKRRFSMPVCQNCGSEQNNLRYLIFPKECSQCNALRGMRVWFVEILMIVSSIYLFYWDNGSLPYLPALFILVYLGIVVIIDIEHRLIMHPVSIVGFILGAILGVWMHGLVNTVIGGVIGFSTMFALYALGLLYVRVRYGSNAEDHKGNISYGDALGFGDVNLAGVLGLLTGWPTIVLVIVLAVILAGIISLLVVGSMLIRRDYRADLAIPYGPFLISGAVLVMFFGDQLRTLFGA